MLGKGMCGYSTFVSIYAEDRRPVLPVMAMAEQVTL